MSFIISSSMFVLSSFMFVLSNSQACQIPFVEFCIKTLTLDSVLFFTVLSTLEPFYKMVHYYMTVSDIRGF